MISRYDFIMRFSKGIRDFTKDTPSEWEYTRISSSFSRDLPSIPRQNGNVGGFRALLCADCLWTPHTIGMFLISTEQCSDCVWAPHTIGMSLIFNGATRELSMDSPQIGMFLISMEQRSDCVWAPHTIGMSLIFNGATRELSMDTSHNRHVLDFNGAMLGLSLDTPHNRHVPDFNGATRGLSMDSP